MLFRSCEGRLHEAKRKEMQVVDQGFPGLALADRYYKEELGGVWVHGLRLAPLVDSNLDREKELPQDSRSSVTPVVAE